MSTILIGVGNAGCKILSKVDSSAEKLFIDTDPDVLTKYSGIRIGENVCGKLPALGDPVLGELSARENKVEILKKIEGYDSVVIIAPLSGGTSCGASKKIVEFALDENKEVKFVTSMPLEFEGGRRHHLAQSGYEYLESLCEIIKVEHNILDKNGRANDIFDELDDLYIEAIDKICI